MAVSTLLGPTLPALALEPGSTQVEQDTLVQIGVPFPEWVVTQPYDETPSLDNTTEQQGADLLLVDQQIKVGSQGRSAFIRVVTQLTNAVGVQQHSQLVMSFDPAVQRIELHRVDVVRDGVRSSRLESEKVQRIRREMGLEANLLDGHESLLVLPTDIRPGDILDYAFSVVDTNHTADQLYAQELNLVWDIPVRQLSLRVLSAPSRELTWRVYDAPDPTIDVRADGWSEYLWSLHHPEVPEISYRAPISSLSWARAEFSEYRDWAAVAEYARSLFEQERSDRSIAGFCDGLRREYPEQEARVLAALRFVQDDVRYFGLELGGGSFRPRLAEEVLASRFGDCKDKTILAAALLTELGIEAKSALVHSVLGANLGSSLPSPGAFNHAILTFEWQGERLWIDPTRGFERGGLQQLDCSALKYALVLDDSGAGLIAIDPGPAAQHSVLVERTFDFAVKLPTLSIKTTYSGHEADRVRSAIAALGTTDFKSGTLDYYRDFYPGATASAQLEVRDQVESGQFEIHEFYSIPLKYESCAGELEQHIHVDPIELSDFIPEEMGPGWTSPIAIAFPQTIRSVTLLKLPFPARGMLHSERKIEDSSFEFYYRSRAVQGRTIELVHEWTTLSAQVSPEQSAQFDRNLSTVDRHLGFMVYREALTLGRAELKVATPAELLQAERLIAVAAKQSSRTPSSRNRRTSSAAGILWLGVFGWLLKRGLQRPAHSRTLYPSSIGGLLILLGLGLIVQPLIHGANTLEVVDLLNSDGWAGMLAQRSSAEAMSMNIAIGAKILISCVSILLSLWQVVSFFRKRVSFPRFFLVFNTLSVLSLFACDAFSSLVLSVPVVFEGGLALGWAVFWSAYLYLSPRAKRTFVVGKNGAVPALLLTTSKPSSDSLLDSLPGLHQDLPDWKPLSEESLAEADRRL